MESLNSIAESVLKKYSVVATDEKIRQVSGWLTDKKANELVALNIPEKASIAESAIIVTASSIRHAQGLADTVLERCREENFEFLRMEGFAVGEWILLDLNDVIVHIFQEESRERYRLEELWPNATVLADTRLERR